MQPPHITVKDCANLNSKSLMGEGRKVEVGSWLGVMRIPSILNDKEVMEKRDEKNKFRKSRISSM